jgi:hypothetical protein
VDALGSVLSIPSGSASPAQGACFSLLALALPNQTITIPEIMHITNVSQLCTSNCAHHSNKATIAGAVVGSVLGIVILVLIIVLWLQKRPNSTKERNGGFTLFDVINSPILGKKRNENRRDDSSIPIDDDSSHLESQGQWREAIESLRREMEEMRQDRYEPPPSYT